VHVLGGLGADIVNDVLAELETYGHDDAEDGVLGVELEQLGDLGGDEFSVAPFALVLLGCQVEVDQVLSRIVVEELEHVHEVPDELELDRLVGLLKHAAVDGQDVLLGQGRADDVRDFVDRAGQGVDDFLTYGLTLFWCLMRSKKSLRRDSQ